MNSSDPSWLAQSPQFLPPGNLVHTLRHEKGFGSRTASGRDLCGIMWVMVLILDWGCAQIWGTGKLIRSHVGYLPIDKPWHLCPRGGPAVEWEMELGPSPCNWLSIMRLFETGYICTLGPPEGCLGWGEHFILWQQNFLWVLWSDCDGLDVFWWWKFIM